MIRGTTDPSTEDLGGPSWLRVILQNDLVPTGKVDCLLTVPKTPANPDSLDDPEGEAWWKATTTLIRGVRNGLPNSDTIPAGTVAWIHNYYGRWVIAIPECY